VNLYDFTAVVKGIALEYRSPLLQAERMNEKVEPDNEDEDNHQSV